MSQTVARPDSQAKPSPPASSWPRYLGAVLAGVVAGFLLSNGLQAGAALIHGEDVSQWSSLYWGDHWVFRTAASLASAGWVGFIAGVLGRRFGSRLGIVATIPGALIWLVMTLAGWGYPVHSALDGMHVHLGYRLTGIALVVAIPAAGWFGGVAGEEEGARCEDHFDSRRHSLLGIKWYHYLWIPFVFQALLVLFTVSTIYGFEWMKIVWQSGPMMIRSIIPMLFSLGVWACIFLLWEGASNAYRVLAGFESTESRGERAKDVLKYALGYPAAAAVLQVGIIALHSGLASWLS